MSDLPWYFRTDVMLSVATRSGTGAPAICRAAGTKPGGGGVVIVFLPVPEGDRMLANISDNGAIALNIVRPSDYRSVQMKGRDAHLVPTAAEDAQRVEAQREGALDACERVGLPRSVTDRMWSRGFVAVAFSPDCFFDQTPGHDAGRAVAP